MDVPPGRLVRSRVQCDASAVLREALDTSLTGYAALEPRDALLGGGGRGLLVFRDGVPTMAYHPDSGAGGAAALAKLAGPGPCRAELHAVDAAALPDADGAAEFRVPPGMPAERLAGAPELAARARRLATEEAPETDSAVLAFLEDERKVEAIRENAREEAERRAEEWGFDDALAE
ncbi:hypothetical protein N0B31_19190 [Salinirubellus salinus]|uniref:DUF8054 domain-containing protein n=1 Tax=Salinirubellus salinus TaxID=1364945 RepID=A0A9E7UD16_9EURY|nr:hypothetical protein [Salinirubellus salinus]UWM56912.1 hypothetical protein N0B31_19190 [Salinirubellus salinus]